MSLVPAHDGLEVIGDHCLAIGERGWSIWRKAMLRSTGFPVSGLALLAFPDLGRVADDYLDGEATAADVRQAFDAAVEESSTRVNRIAADPLLREATAWQNPERLALLSSLLRTGLPRPRNSKRRYREKQLSRVWQRYCAKAETIGFFGPSAWVDVDDGVEGLTIEAGPALLARREVFLEPWALAAYGTALANDEDMQIWMPLVRWPHHALRGSTLHRPQRTPVALTDVELAIVSRSDGHRPAATIAAEVAAAGVGGVTTEDDAMAVVRDLVARGCLKWDVNLASGPQTAEFLASRIAAIGDDALRFRAAAGLDRLCTARDAVAKAAGDAGEVRDALAALDAVFIDLVGGTARRRAGQTYAGRSICYEDTTRDVTIRVGGQVLAAIGGPLTMIGEVARWLTSRLASVLSAELGKRIAELDRVSRTASLADVWDAGIGLCLGDLEAGPVGAVIADLRRRWRVLFDLDAAPAHARRLTYHLRELQPVADELFVADRPGWSTARIHSPDLFVCAASADAVARGEFFVVVGEMHVAYATLCDRWCTWSHNDPTQMLDQAIADFGQRRVLPLQPPALARDAGRVVHIEDAPSDVYLGFGRTRSVDGRRTFPVSELPVSASDDGHVVTLPDGERRPLSEMFAFYLSQLAVNMLRLVCADTAHTPRLAIDRVVILRETWRTTVGDLEPLTAARSELDQFLAGRALVHALRLPDRCFVKIGTEPKPVFVDFNSPLYVSSLCTMLKAAMPPRSVPVDISEMLPSPEHAWIFDHGDNRYLGELRTHVVDPAAAVRG